MALTELTQSERVSWNDFLDRFVWKQGEHVTCIGPTGSGKSTLTNAILDRRSYVVFLATKKKDSTVDELKKDGYRVTKDIGSIHPDVAKKIILKPDFPDHNAAHLKAYHKAFYDDAMMYVFRAGSWCIVCDEVRYLTEFLRLNETYELLLLQGRSLGISVVSSTQRPKKIPLTAYDQATHLFFWRDNDEENLKRIGGLNGLDAKSIRAEVASLPLHDVLYVNTRNGEKLRTKVEQ